MNEHEEKYTWLGIGFITVIMLLFVIMGVLEN
ncbi:hypothetical protein SAMN05877753_1061, partial [Bacillus oleivorans]